MKSVTHEDCIHALKAAHNYFKRNFSKDEYHKWRDMDPSIPNEMTIISKFGKWNKAKEQAGIDLSINKIRPFARRSINRSVEVRHHGHISVKECKQCEETKSLEEFHRLKTGVAGRNSRCKECYNSYKRQHHHANKEKMNQKSKLYYQNNREQVLKRHKEYWIQQKSTVENHA